MASHRCSYCGKAGHKRPTCPDLRGAPSSRATRVVTGTVVTGDGFKRGDIVVIAPGTRFSESLVWGKLTDGSPRKYEVEKTVGPGGTVPCKALNGDLTARPVFAPGDLVLFSPSKTTSVGKKKIDVWEAVENIIPNSRITLLFGPPGTGKTTVGNFAGNPDKVVNITLTEETPMAEIRGHFIPKGDEFVWMDGPGMDAYRNGYRLVMNEIDKASGDCMTFCHALLDDPEISRITLPTGECVSPAPGFSVVATTNAEPDDLPEALRDRFRVAMFIPRPHPKAIASLPEDLQEPANNSFNGEQPVTFRSWKSYAAMRDVVGEDVAALAVFGDRAQAILDTLKLTKVALHTIPADPPNLKAQVEIGDYAEVVSGMCLDNKGYEIGYPDDYHPVGDKGFVRDIFPAEGDRGWDNVELRDFEGNCVGVFYSPNVRKVV